MSCSSSTCRQTECAIRRQRRTTHRLTARWRDSTMWWRKAWKQLWPTASRSSKVFDKIWLHTVRHPNNDRRASGEADVWFRHANSVVITVEFHFSEAKDRQQHKTSSAVQDERGRCLQVVAGDKINRYSHTPTSTITQVGTKLYWTVTCPQGEWDDHVVGQQAAMKQTSLHQASTGSKATDSSSAAGTTTSQSNRCWSWWWRRNDDYVSAKPDATMVNQAASTIHSFASDGEAVAENVVNCAINGFHSVAR